MAVTYDKIATTTLASTASSVTFSSIPATYTDLVLIANPRTSNASTNDYLYVKYNSDGTYSNYSRTELYGNGSNALSGRASNPLIIETTGASSTAGVFVPNMLNIQNYSNTTTYKTTLFRYSKADEVVLGGISLWRNTAAISQIDLIPFAGANISIGSTFTLYGIKAA